MNLHENDYDLLHGKSKQKYEIFSYKGVVNDSECNDGASTTAFGGKRS